MIKAAVFLFASCLLLTGCICVNPRVSKEDLGKTMECVYFSSGEKLRFLTDDILFNGCTPYVNDSEGFARKLDENLMKCRLWR